MPEIGFLPCFSRYNHKEYPIKGCYSRQAYIEKVKVLVSAFLSSTDPFSLKKAIGQEIQVLRPVNSESKKIIKMCNSSDCGIYRIDYGNNPFRIVFGLSNTSRNAYIFLIDVTHNTFNNGY